MVIISSNLFSSESVFIESYTLLPRNDNVSVSDVVVENAVIFNYTVIELIFPLTLWNFAQGFRNTM